METDRSSVYPTDIGNVTFDISNKHALCSVSWVLSEFAS